MHVPRQTVGSFSPRMAGRINDIFVAETSRTYRTFLFCPLCLASFLSLLIAQLVLGKRLDQEGKCLELVSFFRILNTPREFFVGSRRKLINMLRSVQNIHVETAHSGFLKCTGRLSLAARRTCSIRPRVRSKAPECDSRANQSTLVISITFRH